MITETIEIERRPEDVFAYLDRLDRHGEWQEQIVSARLEGEGPVQVGTRAVEKRRIGGREVEMAYEITEHDPPRRSAFRGINGAIRPVGTVTIEPVGDGARSSVRLDFDLEGHGFGKLIAPLARRAARQQIPKDHEQLKQRLESGA